MIPIVQTLFNSVSQTSQVQAIGSRYVEPVLEEQVCESIFFEDFYPKEDGCDQTIAILKELNHIDRHGWATIPFRRGFNFGLLALEQKQLDALTQQLYRKNQLCGLPSKDFSMQELFKSLLKHMQGAIICYAGSGVRKKVLDESYFTKILEELTNHRKTQLDPDLCAELGQKDCDDDYQVLLARSENLPEGTNAVLQFLEDQVDEKYRHLVRKACLNNFCIKAPFFSLVSWTNRRATSNPAVDENVDCDVVFVSQPNDCFLDAKFSIRLNSIVEEKVNGTPLIPNGGHYIHDGEFHAAGGLQGIICFLTRVLKAQNLDNMNNHIFSKLVALISMGRRDYGQGFQFIQQSEKSKKSLPWQITDRFIIGATDNLTIENALQISTYLKKHYPHDQVMALAMTYNACLCISQHVSPILVDEIYKKLLPIPNALDDHFSIFALIDQGVRLGISFVDVTQIHQCFALLALGVKRGQFNSSSVQIFLSKHEGFPVVKIQEENKSVFIRFDPLKGYQTCLALLKDKKISRYLIHVLNAYFPQNSFLASEGSQLSGYREHMKILLKPLQEAILEHEFAENSFLSHLNYYLLSACQTCIPSFMGLENVIKQFPFIHERSNQKRKRILECQLENILFFSKIEPWFNFVANIFEIFHRSTSSVQAWMEALASINDPRLQQLSFGILKYSLQTKRKTYLIRVLAEHLLSTNVELAFEVFKLCDLQEVAYKRIHLDLFLNFSSHIKDHPADFIFAFMKQVQPLFENHDLNDELLTAKEHFETIVSPLLKKIFHSGYKSYVHTLLTLFTKKNSKSEMWRDILNELISHSEVEESLSLWREGKTFKVWRQKDALAFAEYVFKHIEAKNHFIKAEVLTDLCKFSPSGSSYGQIRQLVLSILTNEKGKITARKVPQNYSPYLSKEELLSVELNVIKDDISGSHFFSAAESLLGISFFSENDGSQKTKKIIYFFFSKLMESKGDLKDSKLFDTILKLLSSQSFAHLITREHKIDWIFGIIQKMGNVNKLPQFSSFLHEMLKEIWSQDSFLLYSSCIDYCLKHLLHNKQISKPLKKVVQDFHVHLLFYSLSLPKKQVFFDVVQLVVNQECFKTLKSESRTRLEEHTLRSLKKPNLSKEEVLGFHHLYKGVMVQGNSVEVNFEIVEALITHLLHFSQVTFVNHWSAQLLQHSQTPSQITVLLKVGYHLIPSNERDFQKIFDAFYSKQCVDKDGEFAWKQLVEECLTKSHPQFVFHLIERNEEMLKELDFCIEKLLKHFLENTKPQPHQLETYIKITEHANCANFVTWLDLCHKIERFGSEKIKDQFLHAFKERVLYSDVLKAFPQDKFTCLMRCLSLLEREKGFSAEQWLQDKRIAAFFDEPLLKDKKAEFYSHLLKLIQKKNPLAYVITLHKHMAILMGNSHPEALSIDSVKLLIHNTQECMIIKGCHALQKRFMESPGPEEEALFIDLLARTVSELVKSHQIIGEVAVLIRLYTQKYAIEFIFEAMELCSSHPNKKIKAMFSDLQTHFFSVQESESYHVLEDWVQTSPSLQFLSAFFESSVVEKFLVPNQINQLFGKAIVKLMEKNPCKESLRLFYDHFSRFESLPKLKVSALKEFFSMLFDVDSFINQEDQFWRYLDTFALLWIRQSTKPENYFYKWERLSSEDQKTRVFHLIASSDIQKLEKNLQAPIPCANDPSILDRIFDFANIMFELSTLQKKNLEKNYSHAWGIAKYFLGTLVYLDSKEVSPKNKVRYAQIIETLADQLIYMNEFLCKKMQLGEIFFQLELPKTAEKVFQKLYFYCYQDWPQGFLISDKGKMEIINDLFPILAKHPIDSSRQKAVQLFGSVGYFCMQNFPRTYFSDFKYLLEKIQDKDLSVTLVDQFLEKLAKSPFSAKFSLSTKASLIESSILFVADQAEIRTKSIELFGKFADLLAKMDRQKYNACFEKIAQLYGNLKEFEGLKELQPKTFNFLHLCCFREWPSSVILKINEHEQTKIFEDTIQLLINGLDANRATELFIKHGHLLLNKNAQVYANTLESILNFLKGKEEIHLISAEFEKIAKYAKDDSLRIFETIFHILEMDVATFLESGALLLTGAFHARIFQGNIDSFYEKIHVFGKHMLSSMAAGNLDAYQNVFFPLLFLDFGKTRETKLSSEEKILRLSKINHWQNEFGKMLALRKETVLKRKFKMMVNKIQGIKEEKDPVRFEKATQWIENQLLKNLIRLSANSIDHFTITCDSLQYVQNVILRRPPEERDSHGYELLLECYQPLWEWLENHGMTIMGSLSKVPIFRFIISALIGKENCTIALKETAKGRDCFAKLCIELSHAMLKASLKIAPTDSENNRFFCIEMIAFINKTIDLQVFDNHLEKFYFIVDLFQRFLSHLSPYSENEKNMLTQVAEKAAFQPIDEAFMLQQIFLFILKTWTCRKTHEERKQSRLLICNWLLILISKKRLPEGLKLLRQHPIVEVTFDKLEIKEIKEIG
ncbi:hypothetical protein [Parachlamydia acanthamoebae]|uniref:hypothetical protein n=1 Tax=Parachlamydia acanthamoebae TaxID=83552 RepID=UPI0001C17337|nr:hypothetical protein [Parachlamydia acanthamoebae]EFB40132.1 hypothetical protein pah_c260o039 [Parachlamydia acanthamoebae str. Hall's coccus]